MSSWASRLSTSAKSAATSPAGTDANSNNNKPPSFTTTTNGAGNAAAAVQQHAGPHSTHAAAPAAADLREEFRRVAEAYNEASAVMLRLPPDCWDILTQYLSYMDVVALGQTCRSLWVVLHTRESVWWRQLAYFHRDVRDLRGGKLLCTAPLFPRPPAEAETSASESLVPSPTIAPPPSRTLGSGAESPPRTFAVRASRRDTWVPMSAHERFFQERRVYVLDSHREWHFQELADVEDRATGMFTVALHDGKVESVASPLSAEVASLSFTASVTPPPPLLPRTTASATHTPVLTAMDSGRDASLAVPPSPISLTPQQQLAPTPHRRTGSNQTPGNSAGNSPALAPSPAPPTPPLLPRVGDPIINDHNPLLQLRIYTIDTQGGHCKKSSHQGEEEEEGEEEGEYDTEAAASMRPSSAPPISFAGMTEEQVMEYVLQMSLQEAQQQQQQQARRTPPAESPSDTRNLDPACWPHTHYRGAPGSTSLPLSQLLIILDSINNNAHDQLRHHHVRDCTAEEDPRFLQRLAETLRSAKHRRLHLGNHHRAVRNNGQTTRNRAGRGGDGAAFSVSLTASGGPGGARSPAPPPPPPPMNRMLRGFHGDLLEITEKEARAVATRLLGKPNIIDEFVVFHCNDPAELYRRLCPSCAAETSATNAATWESRPPAGAAGRQVMKHGMLVSVPAPLYVDPVASPSTTTTAPAAASAFSDPSSPLSTSAVQTVMRAPPLKPLPFFTRFFLAPELCHDGYVALIIVDVVRALVVVDKEMVGNDSPDWESPLIDRSGRVVVPGQGYNPQAYTRSDYNYVPPNPPRRRRDSD